MNIAACGNPVTWPKCPIGRAKRGTGAIPCDASGHVRLGQKPTCAAQKGMSALHPKATVKADIRNGHVCFTPESRHVRCKSSCLLWATSGHSPSFDHLVGAAEK